MSKGKPRKKRELREQELWDTFEQIKAAGEPTGPSEFAKRVGINRSYLYRFRELVSELSAYGRQTQPHKSRRGAGIKKLEAKKQELDERVRREHLAWTREVPKLRREFEKQKKLVQRAEESKQAMAVRIALLERALEYLLLLAHEAGVSLREMDSIREKVGTPSQGLSSSAGDTVEQGMVSTPGETDFPPPQTVNESDKVFSATG